MLSPIQLSEQLLTFSLLVRLLERVRPTHKAVVFFGRNFPVNFTIDGMQLVFHHYLQVAVRNPIYHIIIGEMQILHERSYLPQQALVAYCCCFCFAISFPTFRAKADSIVKFWVLTML